MACFTAEERTRLQVAFNKIDKNRDGFITGKELKDLLARFGKDISEARANEILTKCDPDGTGKITFEKFVNGCAIALPIIKAAILLVAAFHVMDADGSGYITSSDLKKLASDNNVDVPAGKIEELIAKCDQNNDGKVSFQEFVHALITFIKANA
ncbi:hypothetical protein HELRODRAFT_109943 [Helobdella robusta]|uniref:EF-hand domain-containing protein n=1 Tax=Helobdella robusta TaxID=6412 RepID=T1EEX6_HELRO|nr:hypothetical protein HELRODRAFT_109943 [Helobdella robusta]ESO08922.1 hypothetical protein HELRODRAFT_109943 [Helobdella robusta]